MYQCQVRGSVSLTQRYKPPIKVPIFLQFALDPALPGSSAVTFSSYSNHPSVVSAISLFPGSQAG